MAPQKTAFVHTISAADSPLEASVPTRQMDPEG
jgi:hypothetical protein